MSYLTTARARRTVSFRRYFGTAPELWMDLQSDFELRRAQRGVGAAITAAVRARAA